MIVDLPDTTISEVSKALVRIREEGGAVALGRVLTLVISTVGAAEEAIEAANDASREHPMRVIVVTRQPGDDLREARLDAQIRVGGDSGASEVIVLSTRGELSDDEEGLVTGLLLPDAPVVAWWPGQAPRVPSQSALGRIAQRRITDAAAQSDPRAAVHHLAEVYAPGDTDFAWTRLTLWRAQLAAVLDQPPYESITGVRVSGAPDSASTMLLAAWLRLQLDVDVVQTIDSGAQTGSSGIHAVALVRASGTILLDRNVPNIATLIQPGQPVHTVSLPQRSLRDCLAEELRRLHPDELYGRVLRLGLGMLDEHPDAGDFDSAGGAAREH